MGADLGAGSTSIATVVNQLDPMSSASANASRPVAARPWWRDNGGWLVLGAVVWLPLLARLQIAWRHDPELMHGWLVPLLAGYVGWTQSGATVERTATPTTGRFVGWAWTLLGVGLVAGLLWLPVLEANPLWPSAQWLAFVLAVGVTLALAWLADGKRGLRRVAFPLFFMHTALAWPTAIREPVMSALMQSNAAIAVEVLSLLGKTAVVRGNIIEVESGLIGVEEACSGLRSLQSVWMFAWLFGAIYQLGWGKRLRLVIAALATAWAGNLVRTLFLTWQIERGGAAAGEAWHDSSGLILLGATLAVVLALARHSAARSVRAEMTAAQGGELRCPANAPPRGGIVFAAALLAGVAHSATWWWYAAALPPETREHWRLAPDGPAWEPVPIDARVTELLGCSSGDHFATRSTGRGGQALALVLRWEEDRRVLVAGNLGHGPRVCMPAIGGHLARELPAVHLAQADGDLIFAAYVFETHGRTQHVFDAFWTSADGAVAPEATTGRRFSIPVERLRRVISRQRFTDFDRIVFVLQDGGSDAQAIAWLQETAPQLLRR